MPMPDSNTAALNRHESEMDRQDIKGQLYDLNREKRRDEIRAKAIDLSFNDIENASDDFKEVFAGLDFEDTDWQEITNRLFAIEAAPSSLKPGQHEILGRFVYDKVLDGLIARNWKLAERVVLG